MKKDKAVRNSEIRAAIIRQLKSLLAPFIILLIIVGAVLVIALWKEEAEPIEVVRVNGYEGEARTFTLENDKIIFELDSKTTHFTVTVKDSGKVWYSNPESAGADSLATSQEKNKLRSTLILTYSNSSGVDIPYDNYAYSIERGVYDIEAEEDYIKVYYSIGNVDKEFVIPPVILEEKMDALKSQMSKEGQELIRNYYRRYDIDNLGRNDDRDELLEKYPILETEVIYVLGESTRDNIKTKFEQLFTEAGYTYEDYLSDKELDLAEKTSDKPVFNVPIIYRLDGDDLLVEIPANEIEFKDEYPVYSLSVLPYFGAGGVTDQGFLLVPEGGGGLINFNNGKTRQTSYYANVYGWDMASARSAVVHETRSNFNVFGVSNADDAFICVLEDGAPYASVQADISGRTNSYNYVNAVYSILYREQYDIADKSNDSVFVYEDQVPQESFIQRYQFIDSGSYVDMANTYRQYLLGRYGSYLTVNDDAAAPVVLEIIGAIDKTKQVAGVPVSKPLKVTSFSEAREIVEELGSEGLRNMSVKLSGWMNGGVNQKILSRVKPVSELGSQKSLNALATYAEENDIALYLNGITNYAYDSGIFDGFLIFSDAAEFVSNESVELYPYSTVTYGQLTGRDAYYLLRVNKIKEMVKNLEESASKYNANISFEDIGRDLSSDFSVKGYMRRQGAMVTQSEWLKDIYDSNTKIMINMGNDYAMPYSSMITNMDLSGSEYGIIDHSVPFYQIAIHGYVNYTGESLNMTQDWEEELLKSAEYGAGLSFTVMYESALVLQNTNYTDYFGADYSLWHDRIVTVYNRYNDEMGNVFDQKISDHRLLTDTLSCTIYEDGTKVYVNYSYSDVTTDDGTLVPARDYKVVP